MKKNSLSKLLFTSLVPLSSVGFVSTITTSCVNKEEGPTIATIAHVENVELDITKIETTIGMDKTIKAQIFSKNAAYKTVTWESLDTSVATVEIGSTIEEGIVKGIGIGGTTITATVDGKTASCEVTVKEEIDVTSIYFNQKNVKLNLGETFQLTHTIIPSNATNKSVSYLSFEPNIATVDNNGVVTAKSYGQACIMIKTASECYSCCDVFVPCPTTSFSLSKNLLDLKVGETEQLTTGVVLDLITWNSSDPSIAAVDENGLVTANSVGTATITARAVYSEKEVICLVCVTNDTPVDEKPNINPVEAVKIDKNKLNFNIVKDELEENRLKSKLNADVYPDVATNKSLIWTSSNPNVATVDNDGNITLNSKLDCNTYKTKITVKSNENDNIYDACEITVKIDPIKVVNDDFMDKWGGIAVVGKLMSNHEFILFSKENGDSEYGYLAGSGVLRIPDSVYDGNEWYYVKKIPTNWSDGENSITGIRFVNVNHLEEICDRAFYNTNCFDNYVKYGDELVVFPKSLRRIGQEAFYGTYYGSATLKGYEFPTNIKISANAFKKCPTPEMWIFKD